MNWSVGAAFVMGLVGSVHCAGMCGSLIMAVGGALDAKPSPNPMRKWPSHLVYHLGRLITYTSLGIAAGAGGHLLTHIRTNTGFPIASMIFTIVMLLGAALYFLGIGPELDPARRGGFADIVGRVLREVAGMPGAFILGIVTGYFPCAILFSALALAVGAASSLNGAAIMLSFWAGTMPLLFVIGHSGRFLIRRLRGNAVLASGLVLLSVAIAVMSLNFAAYESPPKARNPAPPQAQHPAQFHSH